MTTDLEPRQAGSTFDRLGLNPMQLAEQLATVPEFVPKGMANRPGAVLAAILTGDELGIGPMSSLAKIDVIEGRASLAAELMRGIVLARGHELWAHETSSQKVTLGGRRLRPDGSYGETTYVTWTMEDAKRAGLDRKNNWRNYPRAMLTARATGELCRLIFADELAGIRYTREEVADGFMLEEEDPAEALPSGDGDLGERPEGAPEPSEPTTTRKADDAGRTSKPIETTAKPAAAKATKATKARTKTPKAEPPPPPPLPGEEASEAAPPVAPAEGEPSPAPDEGAEDAEGGRYTPAQALAMAAIDAGLDDDHRHGLVTALTGGRTRSGKDLERDELDQAFDLVKRVKAGELEVVEVDRGAFEVRAVADAELVELFGVDVERSEGPPAQGPEALGDVEAWRAYLKSKGLKVAEVLRAAASLAPEGGAKPRNLGELVESIDLAAQVHAWAEREAGQ